MTVKAENKIHQDLPVSMDAVGLDRTIGDRKVVPIRKVRTEVVDVEQESGGSSTEEVESPKSVAKFGRKKVGRYVHNRVLRVKEEDLLLREDIDGEGYCLITQNHEKSGNYYQERHVNVVVLARPTTILPCSPLSGKTNVTSVKTASH